MSQAVCDICRNEQPTDNAQPAALWLGQHKKRAHGIAGSSPTTAKRKRRQGRGDRAPRERGDKRPPPLKGEIQSVFRLVGGIVGVVDPFCGDVLAKQSDEFAGALAEVAKRDARVERWLRGMGTVGPYGALFLAAGKLALPIAAHHGLVDPILAGMAGAPVPPEPEPNGSRRGGVAEAGPDMGEDRQPTAAPASTHPTFATEG